MAVMAEQKTYNGWTNYETWATALWIDNEESTYRESRRMARRASGPHTFADQLEEWVTDMAPDLGASLFSDLLNAALGEVNWDEIADNYLEEVKDDAGEESEE